VYPKWSWLLTYHCNYRETWTQQSLQLHEAATFKTRYLPITRLATSRLMLVAMDIFTYVRFSALCLASLSLPLETHFASLSSLFAVLPMPPCCLRFSAAKTAAKKKTISSLATVRVELCSEKFAQVPCASLRSDGWRKAKRNKQKKNAHLSKLTNKLLINSFSTEQTQSSI